MNTLNHYAVLDLVDDDALWMIATPESFPELGRHFLTIQDIANHIEDEEDE
jgi:hypothetical protein